MATRRLSATRDPRSGVALLTVLVSIALMAVLIIEIIFSSNVEINISRNARDRLQGYYLAQSATRLGLLRLQMYREVNNSPLKAQIEGMMGKGAVDKIWSIPVPEFPLATMDAPDWPGTMNATIKGEGSKIALNLLDGKASPEYARWRGMGTDAAKTAEGVYNELSRLIVSQMDDEDWERKYRGTEAKDLVDPLVDWIDPDPTRVGGGDESSDYEKFDPPYFPRNDRFATLTELSMIKGWTDEWIERLSSSFSLLNTQVGADANHISLDRLKSIHTALSLEDLKAIETKRQTEPFGSLSDLVTFIQTSPDVRNGRDFKAPEEWANKGFDRTGLEESTFYIEGSSTVGETHRGIRLGVRIDKPPFPGCNEGEEPDACTKRREDFNKTAKADTISVVTVEETP